MRGRLRRGCLRRRGLGGLTKGRLRRLELVDEPSPRVVVTAIVAEEAFEAAGQFLGAICVERLDPLVVRAPTPFVIQASPLQPVIRHTSGEAPGAVSKLVQVCAEGSCPAARSGRPAGYLLR